MANRPDKTGHFLIIDGHDGGQVLFFAYNDIPNVHVPGHNIRKY